MAIFWHCGFTVRDLERSARFYREVVGMEEGERIASANAEFRTLSGVPDATLETVFLTAGPFTLQLIQYVAGGGPAIEPGHNRAGSPHLSFFVDDIAASHAAIAARGDVPITSPIVTNARGTIRSFYVTDPDGVPVELVERIA